MTSQNRRRRIKCDEGKPHCLRCSSTGRVCDGYISPAATVIGSSWENHSWDHSATPIVVQSYRPDIATNRDGPSRLSVQPQLYAFDTPKEAESFDFFQSYSVRELTGLFRIYEKFWHDSVLPASMTQPTVRHAVTALGALHLSFATGHSTSVPEDTSDAQVRFAAQQCNRSFKAFSEYTDSQGLNNQLSALVACILYICVASLQGHQSLAAIHFRNGINLVNNLSRSGKSISQEATAYDAQFASLVAILTTLETQARSLLCNENLPACITASKPDYPLFSKDEVVFHTITEAWNFFEVLLNDLQCFFRDQESESHWPIRGSYPQGPSVERYQILANRNAAGKGALDSLSKRYGGEHGQEQKTILVVRLHARIFDMYLTFFPLAPMHGEMAWDYLEPHFRETIVLSRQILECRTEDLSAAISSLKVKGCESAIYGSNSHKVISEKFILANIELQRQPVFTFSHGTSGPLYTVAMRCRSPELRLEAIALLLQYPRREGLWDSFTAGRLGWEAMKCEEEMCQDRFGKSFQISHASDIPACCRIKDVEVTWTGSRTAIVIFRTVGESETVEAAVMVKAFEW